MELQQWARTQNNFLHTPSQIIPVILFPNASTTLSTKADALLFMTLLNSKSLKYLIQEQMKATKYIHENKIETISTGYLIFEPGMKVGEVGEANLVKIDDLETTRSWARLAKYFDYKILYLEAGSGAISPIPENIISLSKLEFQGLLFVGGGIKTPKQAKTAALAGADWIVTGNLLESFEDYNNLKIKLKRLIDEKGVDWIYSNQMSIDDGKYQQFIKKYFN